MGASSRQGAFAAVDVARLHGHAHASLAHSQEGRLDSKQFSARDVAAHTKLKFRQPGQGGQADVTRRDLRRELAEAERQAAERKGIKAPPAPATKTIEGAPAEAADDSAEDPAAKRWKLVEGMGDLDKDDSDDEGETAEAPATNGDVKGKGKAVDVGEDGAESDEEDEDDDDSDDDDDEDETAELLRELEKIKRERAEEKERLVSPFCSTAIPLSVPTDRPCSQERERNVDEEAEREERIAFGKCVLPASMLSVA